MFLVGTENYQNLVAFAEYLPCTSPKLGAGDTACTRSHVFPYQTSPSNGKAGWQTVVILCAKHDALVETQRRDSSAGSVLRVQLPSRGMTPRWIEG